MGMCMYEHACIQCEMWQQTSGFLFSLPVDRDSVVQSSCCALHACVGVHLVQMCSHLPPEGDLLCVILPSVCTRGSYTPGPGGVSCLPLSNLVP